MRWAEKRFHSSRSLSGHLYGENEAQTRMDHPEDESGGDGGVGTLVFSVPLPKVAAMNKSPWCFLFFFFFKLCLTVIIGFSRICGQTALVGYRL